MEIRNSWKAPGRPIWAIWPREALRAQKPGRRKARPLPDALCCSSGRGRQSRDIGDWIPRPCPPGFWVGRDHNAPLAYLTRPSHSACIANCPWSGHAGEGPPRQPQCTLGPRSWAGPPSWGASREACETGISLASGPNLHSANVSLVDFDCASSPGIHLKAPTTRRSDRGRGG